ncbi:MAG: hypothetical protein ACRDRL_22840 [Sciscionella sp.]
MGNYRSILQDNALPQGWDYNALVHFARTMIPPAPALYMTVDDVLQARVFSPTVSAVVNVSWRIQTPDGQVIPGQRSITAATAGTVPLLTQLEKVEGFLLSVSVESPGVPRGQVFVQVEVVRGQGSQDVTGGHVVLGGYPGSGQKIAFPQSPIASPGAGPGWTSTVVIANPAAGADFTQTVPAGEQWILRSARALLTSSAAVANRSVQLQAVDTTPNILVSSPAFAVQAASLAVSYDWFNGGGGTSVANSQTGAWPYELRLQPGWKVQSKTALIDVADQWSLIVLGVERFITT